MPDLQHRIDPDNPGDTGCAHHVYVTLGFVVDFGCYGGVLDLATEAGRLAILDLVRDRINDTDGVEIHDVDRIEVLDTHDTDTGETIVEYEPGTVTWNPAQEEQTTTGDNRYGEVLKRGDELLTERLGPGWEDRIDLSDPADDPEE
jgi:hypothetical protein